jgi:predicted MFS family arabinose efflux permease
MPAEPSPSAGGVTHLFANIRGGLFYVVHAAAPRTVLVRAAAIGVPSSATLALLPVLVHQRLRGSSLDYGLLLGCFGMGAVCSAFLLTNLRRRIRPETLLSGATLVFAASLLGLAGAGARAPMCLALLGGGIAWVAMLTTLNTAMQFAAHVAFRGRALAAYMTCAFGGLMIGSVLWGRVAYLHGLTAAFVAAGLLLAATAVLHLAFSLPEQATGD